MPLDSLTLDRPATPALYLAPWHAARPHLVATALSEAKRIAPHLAGLADQLLPWMPRKPQASQNLRAITINPSSSPMLLDDAVGCPWICPNTEAGWNVLTIDVDHDDADDLADDLVRLGLPRPTVVTDPWSGRAHVWCPLATPVSFLPGARLGPQILADLACRLLAAAFRGTALPRAALVKSPWGLRSALIGQPMRRTPTPGVPAVWEAFQEARTGLMWHTRPGDGTYELRAIVAALAEDYAEDAAPSRRGSRFRKRRGDPSWQSRNDFVFDLTRWWAYDRCEKDGGAIADEAQRINGTLANPLPASAIAATARSITRFMTTRFKPQHGQGPDRGRDREAGHGMDAQARQALAGATTAAAKVSATDRKLMAGLEALQATRQPLTQQALAAAAGVSLRTVKARWHQSVPMVHFAELSGGAPLRASPLPSTKESSSLADLVRLAKEQAVYAASIAAVVADLEELTETWSRPGAEPGTLPAIPADLAHLVEIRRAKAAAIAALTDARRRAIARQLRAEAADRMEEMVRRAQDRRAGWAWFKTQHLADLDLEWDARASGADDGELRHLRDARDAVFSGRWRQWRRALQLAQPARRQARDIDAELAAIPY